MEDRLLNKEDHEYFDYICRTIGKVDYYTKLAKYLFNKEYYWIVIFDDDRETDALDFRKEYFEYFGMKDPMIMKHASVLEVLVALATNCEDDLMHEVEYGDRTAEWFWMMINNLGLGRFDDDHFDEKKVDMIVEKWLARAYSKDGKGGLFPLRFCKIDQTVTDLWSQLQYYLIEKYGI